ncbi:MAG: anaerobic sulfatase-maturation protein [Verrucomicrobia bacterium]|nr:anaerobic sulfatase-maturation protein [Verrucomicrobiota bacterium]
MTTTEPFSSKYAAPKAFHVMTKPMGPICNLDCSYCFYLEKENLYPAGHNFKMTDEVLESYIRQYIDGQDAPVVTFAWQGGEPTLLGVKFFRKVVELQVRYANGKVIHNALQTNGTLLTDEWCVFFRENNFLIGLSIDGPARLHNACRVDKKGGSTYDEVLAGLRLLKKHGVEFNTLTVVNRKNVRHALDVYCFLRDIGSGFIQFIPLVERLPDKEAKALGLDLALPPRQGQDEEISRRVTEWTVPLKEYGEFLCTVFDEWVQRDVGRVFVQIFDVALGNWSGQGGGLCVFNPTCGTALAMEHNGDVYSCDHYVYPQYHLGNIMNSSLGDMVGSIFQGQFGHAKSDRLPNHCRECDVRFACHGECPKHRFIRTPDGEPGLNYLCVAYKQFFRHVDPYMKEMAALLRAGRAPAEIMSLVRKQKPRIS